MNWVLLLWDILVLTGIVLFIGWFAEKIINWLADLVDWLNRSNDA